jgi:hypothetical protein
LGDRLSQGGFQGFLGLVVSLCQFHMEGREFFFGELSGRVEDWLLDDNNPDLQVAAAYLLVSFVWRLNCVELSGFHDFFRVDALLPRSLQENDPERPD